MDDGKHSFKADAAESIFINVLNCGWQQCQPGYAVGPIVRDRYIIHHVFSGCGLYEVGGRSYPVTQGDTFLIRPNQVVAYRADGEHPWEYCWVGFTGADVPSLLMQTDFSKETPVISTGESEQMRKTMRQIYDASGEQPYQHTEMIGRLYLLFSILIRDRKTQSPGSDIGMSYVRGAIDYISANYQKYISVDEIAAAIGISRSHLYRIFHDRTGLSPKGYLEKYRINRACTLLTQTTCPIKEVAYLVGHDDPLNFSKAFKRHIGVSPAEYRKRHNRPNDTDPPGQG